MKTSSRPSTSASVVPTTDWTDDLVLKKETPIDTLSHFLAKKLQLGNLIQIHFKTTGFNIILFDCRKK
jgi:hypothetical protein